MHAWRSPYQDLKKLPKCGFVPIANFDEVTLPYRAYIVYLRGHIYTFPIPPPSMVKNAFMLEINTYG